MFKWVCRWKGVLDLLVALIPAHSCRVHGWGCDDISLIGLVANSLHSDIESILRTSVQQLKIGLMRLSTVWWSRAQCRYQICSPADLTSLQRLSDKPWPPFHCDQIFTGVSFCPYLYLPFLHISGKPNVIYTIRIIEGRGSTGNLRMKQLVKPLLAVIFSVLISL